MKKKYSILFISLHIFILCIAQNCNIAENLSDSIWLQLYSKAYNTNVEISEIRNEYLFCRLETDTDTNYGNSFILFLYNNISNDSSFRNAIKFELRNPINDNINIEICVVNIIKSKVCIDFKRWLIGNLLDNHYNNDCFNNIKYNQLQWECLDDESLAIQNFYACDSNLIYQSFNPKNGIDNNLTNTIKYDPDDNIRKDGQIRPPEAALAHELGHAENDKNGDTVKYDRAIANGEKGTKKEQAAEQGKRDLNEINSIYYENIVREKEGYPLRDYNYSAGD
ncbi:MAG: hypothetical protein IKN91_01295 [Paludibacteraceae bacterium]|nr:hypothetical protein [Paludibacteraceae bacterium]